MSDISFEASQKFESVHNPQAIHTYLTEGAKLLVPVSMWSKDQTQPIRSRLLMVNPIEQSFRIWVPEEFDEKAFLTNIETQHSVEHSFSVALARALLFFKANFLSHDEAGLKFRLPEVIFRAQRRKNERLIVEEPHLIKVDFQDPLFEYLRLTKKVFDISLGGLSFLTSHQDLPLYPKGLIFKDMHFNLGKDSITTMAEVRKAIQIIGEHQAPQLQVGVTFKNIPPETLRQIALYIFVNNRNSFKRTG